MFTGIITETGFVDQVEPVNGGSELQIACSFASDTHIDESISINGVCLTVINRNENSFSVQCVEETLRKTSFAYLAKGDEVNLERSLTLDKAIEGHIVQGHVDTTGTIETIEESGNDRLITVSYPAEYGPYIVGRGSITVDGISLTVARIEESRFTVAIIPYTWDYTNLGNRSAGDTVNLEFDIFGKYIVRYMDQRFPGGQLPGGQTTSGGPISDKSSA
ncbi:MAG: riboflavin synthase [Balneolaceae bacterium]